MQARHSFWWHVLIDLPILLIVAALCVLLEVGVLPSRQTGFVCNDPSLSFPHMGDTFPISLVAFITVFVPFFMIWAVEATLHREDEYLGERRLCASARRTARVYREYLLAAVLTLSFAELVKCVAGAPRPTFFDLCEPDQAKTCNGSQFVAHYRCTSTRFSSYLALDASRSFPSAHAALSVYTGLFLAWYLQRRAFSWSHRAALAAPALQLLCVSYGAACALSRAADRRHHARDVLAGAALGAASAVYAVVVLCKNFSQQSVASASDLSSSDGTNHPSVRRLLAAGAHPALHAA